jgi:hypothetical protein
MFQVSLRQLFIFLTAIAFAIASLRYPTPWWQSVIGLILLFAFFAALIAAIFERGPQQAFALGFAIVVLSYALMIVNGRKAYSPQGNMLTYDELHGVGYLPTTVMLGELYDMLYRGGKRNASPAAGSPSQSNFARTGHAWWGLLLGYLGGSFAQRLDARRRSRAAAENRASANLAATAAQNLSENRH